MKPNGSNAKTWLRVTTPHVVDKLLTKRGLHPLKGPYECYEVAINERTSIKYSLHMQTIVDQMKHETT